MTSKRGKPDFLELVKSKHPTPVKPPRLLALIQDNMLERCERLLEALFLASDDAFYDLSSRASNNSEETFYFDAVRAIRIARQGVVRSFAQNIRAGFTQLINAKTPSSNTGNGDFAAHNLSLLDGDELEVDLALTSMVSRARRLHQKPLYELCIRLDHLVLQCEIDESNNPLDPQAIARAFVDACADSAKIDIKIRLILFKLFEKHVLKELKPIYDQANEILVKTGILAKVPRGLNETAPAPQPSAVEQPDASNQPHPAEPSAETNTPKFNLSLDTLMSLMTCAQATAGSASSATASRAVYRISTSNNPGPVMPAPQLTAMLTRAQLSADRQLSHKPRNIVPDLINALLRKADAHAPHSLQQTDEAVINLVSMFFDEALADDNLPLAVYALICRLQIPVLKIALQDASFFSRHDHPARELINTISEVGIGFDENKPLERDPVYRTVAEIVQRLSREYQVDEAAFAAQLQELKAAIEAERRRSRIVEARTNQCAAGRSRIRRAKRHAQGLLLAELQDVQLPFAVNDFLTTAWLQVLIITELKYGHESALWADNAEVVSDLIWVSQKHLDTQSLQRRHQLQPDLIERIKGGLEAAIESAEVREAKVRNLQIALHRLNVDADNVAFGPLTSTQREALGQPAEPQQRDYSPVDVAEDEATTAESLEEIRNLTEGSWVEFCDTDTGDKWRYKLAAKVDDDIYVFVNRFGFRVFERSCVQLAHDMQNGRMKPVSSSEFFDRMMNKAVSRIGEAA
jgi:hypothetical protein